MFVLKDMAGKWHSEKDFEDDFWSMAEIPMGSVPAAKSSFVSGHQTSFPNTKPVLKSIYLDRDLVYADSDKEREDDDDDDDERIYSCLPSRGRSLRRNLKRPGRKVSDNEFYRQVRLDIRQVWRIQKNTINNYTYIYTILLFLQVAGPGYSNELIEHAFKTRDDDDNDEVLLNKKVYFKPTKNNNVSCEKVCDKE